MSLAERVRSALQDMGRGTVREVADFLEVQTSAQVEQVRKAIHDLVAAGEVKDHETADGFVYEWLGRRTRPRGDKQAKLWRAMQVKAARGEAFTIKDLAVLAGTSLDYAKRYLRFCIKQGLMLAGPKKGNTMSYVFAKPQGQSEAPAWNRRAENKKQREASASLDPCQEYQKRVKGLLGEMKQAVKAIFVDAEMVLGIVDEMEADLLTRSQEGVSNGKDLDQPSES